MVGTDISPTDLASIYYNPVPRFGEQREKWRRVMQGWEVQTSMKLFRVFNMLFVTFRLVSSSFQRNAG